MDLRRKLEILRRDYLRYKEIHHVMTMPKIPIIYTYLNGKYYEEFQLHDIHYGVDYPITRVEADKNLYWGICAKSPHTLGKIFATMTYIAVRVIGWYHWNTPD